MRPNYDSGWVSAPAGGAGIPLTHNLDTKDFAFVSVIGAYDSAGACQMWVGGTTSSGSQAYGNWVQTKDTNNVVVSAGGNGSMWGYGYGGGCKPNVSGQVTHIRVKIWK